MKMTMKMMRKTKMKKKMRMKMKMKRKMKMEMEGKRTKSSKIPDIYFCVSGKWYAINSSSWSFSSSSNWDDLPKSPDLALPPIPAPIESPEFASFGSKIYATGGVVNSPERRPPTFRSPGLCLFPSDKVFCFDTHRPDEGWKEAPPMSKPRMYHYMLADAGKIYVLGGLTEPSYSADKKQPLLFADVYDPNSGDAWQELAHIQRGGDMNIPLSIFGHAIVQDQHDDFRKKILFHSYYSQNLFYLQTTLTDGVGVYDHKFPQYMPLSAFLDGTLYFLSRDRIFAYDVPSGGGSDSFCRPKLVVLRDVRTFCLPSRGWLGYEVESNPTGYLLSLGNSYLALIWTREIDFEVFRNVHCSILKMSKEGDTFEGKFVACSTYTVQGGSLEGCMAVCSPQQDVGSDTKLGESTESSNKQQLQLKKKECKRKRKRDTLGSNQQLVV